MISQCQHLCRVNRVLNLYTCGRDVHENSLVLNVVLGANLTTILLYIKKGSVFLCARHAAHPSDKCFWFDPNLTVLDTTIARLFPDGLIR